MSRRRKPQRSFFERGTLTVARALIGMHLVHDDGRTVRAGRIVETEAYLGPHDLAAHSARGRTPRNEVMFGPRGHAYVYFIYGFWDLLNVISGPPGAPQAVLLRALEPLAGLTGRTWGPGLLCRALRIDRHRSPGPQVRPVSPASGSSARSSTACGAPGGPLMTFSRSQKP